MGSLLEKVPYLQNGLSMISFVGGLAQAYKGLGEMKRGEKTDDDKLKMNAVMNFAAGSCFASKVFCIAGMGIEGAKSELNRAIDKGDITAEQANAVVQSTVGVIAGPIGRAINWVWSKTPWGKKYEITQQSIEELVYEMPVSKLRTLKPMENKGLSKKEFKRALKQLDFTDKEVKLIREHANIPSTVTANYNIYKFSDNTMESLEGKVPKDKIETLKSLKKEELTDKELSRKLKKEDFSKGEIALVKAFADRVEKYDGEDTGEDNIYIGSKKRAASIAIGGASGALAGGFAGPYLGVLGGFAVGGPIGGTVGLIAGAIIGFHTGRRIGGAMGNIVGKGLERIFDGKKVTLEDEALPLPEKGGKENENIR